MENEDEKYDSKAHPEVRRTFFRKLVGLAAATGLSGLLLGKLAQPVSANNVIPPSGQATFDGPVGIATTTPETLLHVSGPADADVFCGLGPHPNTIVSGQYVGPAMNYGYAGNSFGEGAGFFNVRPDPNAVAPNPSLRFMTNNIQRMIITNAGKVGIQTNAPQGTLHVANVEWESLPLRASSFTGHVVGAALTLDSTPAIGGHSYSLISTGTAAETGAGFLGIWDDTAGGYKLVISPAGKVGIGNLDPGAGFDVYGPGIGTGVDTAILGLSGAASGTGVGGICTGGTNPTGVYGSASVVTAGSKGFAGWFLGQVQIINNLYKGGGGFKIDHPVDPANKILFHSFVESPDMKNLYDGVAALDANGQAVVQLPAYFSALNSDYRYQLTPIGGPMPNLHVASKVSNNQFTISGGTPNAEVSWAVTGIRQDAYANRYRVPTEVNKAPDEVNNYLHPEVYGKPASQTIGKQIPKPPASTTPTTTTTTR